jgi:hypothetical protein
MQKPDCSAFPAVLIAAAAVLFAPACQQNRAASAAPPAAAAAVMELATPAGPASGTPDLSVYKDQPLLSWVERKGEKHALKFSTYENSGWSRAQTIAEGSNWFVNWADFPSVMKQPDGTLVAHWLEMSGPAGYAYDVRIARSADGGRSWSRPLTPHRDGTKTEHGFVSLLPWTGGRTGAVWLDGRKFAGKEPAPGGQRDLQGAPSPREMTLRFAAMDARATLSEEVELDGRVCECCQTSAALTGDGAIVVYRDRSAREIRDIAVVRYRKGKWTAPQILHDDGWEIHGCPVNGPAVAAEGQHVAVAWFTGAQGRARVLAIFSHDAGATFGAPMEISSGRALGRVDVVLLADGSALVSWLEGTEQSAQIRALRLRPDGTRDAPVVVRETSASRKSGFPRMARAGQNVFFAWTEISSPGEPARVRTAVLTP